MISASFSQANVEDAPSQQNSHVKPHTIIEVELVSIALKFAILFLPSSFPTLFNANTGMVTLTPTNHNQPPKNVQSPRSSRKKQKAKITPAARINVLVDKASNLGKKWRGTR
jgi:hypothetical protein